jgi:spore germination protein KC
VEKSIYQDAMAAVNKSRELHSDFMGFGEKIYETNPKLWRELEQTWRDEWLPNIQTDISVSFHLTRTGLTAEPVKPIP